MQTWRPARFKADTSHPPATALGWRPRKALASVRWAHAKTRLAGVPPAVAWDAELLAFEDECERGVDEVEGRRPGVLHLGAAEDDSRDGRQPSQGRQRTGWDGRRRQPRGSHAS
jgi:hypothetical protein